MRTPPALLIAPIIVFTACTRVGSTGPAPVHPAQRLEESHSRASHQDYEGRLGLGDQEFLVMLRVEPVKGVEAEAVLRIPALGLEAKGAGTATGNRLALSLRYDDGCEGVMTIEAHLSDGGLSGDGTLDAADCTGRESGALALALLPEGEPPLPR